VYTESAVLNRKVNQKHTEESTVGNPRFSGIQARFSAATILKTKDSASRCSIPQCKACSLRNYRVTITVIDKG
jgi:hypothetical protein